MTSKILRAWGAGCGTALALRLMATVGVLALLALCVGAAAIVPLPAGVDRELVVFVSFAFALALAVVLAVGLALLWIVRRGRQLDAAFSPLGIPGRQYLTNGRQYHGRYGQRRVDAYFYRGPTFDLYLGTSLQTRLTVAQHDHLARSLAGQLGRQPLALDEPWAQPLTIYAADEVWARGLLADSSARAAVLRFVHASPEGRGHLELRSLVLQPEAWSLRLRYVPTASITHAQVSAWLRELDSLAAVAESLPPPRVTAVATAIERSNQQNRDRFLLPAVAIALGLVVALALCGLAPVAILVLTGQ